MTEREKRANNALQGIARDIKSKLPEGMGFALLAYEFGDGDDKKLMYVSNSSREDVCDAMLEFIEKTQLQYGKHENKPGEVWLNIGELLELHLPDNANIRCLNKHNYTETLIPMHKLKNIINSIDGIMLNMYQFNVIEKGENNAK